MKIVKEKIIDDKLAQLVLLDDNITVNVLYDGVCIDSSDGNTWNNIKDEDWIQETLIDFAVKEVSKEVDAEFLSMLDELD